MYILLNGVNGYLTSGMGFPFFHFFSPFYVICFSFVILRVTVFRGHPVNAFREIRFEYTLAHVMLFMCIRDRLFRTTDAGEQKGNRETTALPIAGQ